MREERSLTVEYKENSSEDGREREKECLKGVICWEGGKGVTVICVSLVRERERDTGKGEGKYLTVE